MVYAAVQTANREVIEKQKIQSALRPQRDIRALAIDPNDSRQAANDICGHRLFLGSIDSQTINGESKP